MTTTDATQGGHFQLPSDAVIYNNGSALFAVFSVSGVNISYKIDWTSPNAPSWNQQAVHHVSAAQFQALQAVDAGDAEELRGYTTQFPTYQAFFNQVLDSVMPSSNVARSDAGVLRVIAEFAGRPDMSLAELQNKLQSTDYYQARTQAQLEWNGLTEPEKAKRREGAVAQMQQAWFQYGGVNLDASDPRIANYLEDIVSGKTGFGAWTEQVVKGQAAQDPNSPWGRTIAEEKKNQLQGGVDIENTAARIRDLARKWGVQWSQATYQDWAQRVTTNTASEADVLQALKDQASVLYPWKNPEMDTQSASSPWIETYNRVMEKQADLFEPKVQAALTAGTPVWEFEQSLKKSSDWLNTKNAKQEMTSVMAEAGRRMGFN